MTWVFGTFDRPYRLVRYDPRSDHVHQVTSDYHDYYSGYELSALDRVAHVYYDVIFDIRDRKSYLVGWHIDGGHQTCKIRLPFLEGHFVGVGKGLAVNHVTSQLYISGMTNTSTIAWYKIDPKSGNFTLLSDVPVTKDEFPLMFAPSAVDSKQGAVWTALGHNHSGHFGLDFLRLDTKTGHAVQFAETLQHNLLSMYFDEVNDRLYGTSFVSLNATNHFGVASFTPQKNFSDWQTATLRGFEPFTSLDAFAHRANADPILYAIAHRVGDPRDAPLYIVGWDIKTGAQLTQRVACARPEECPHSIEAVEM